MKIPFKKINLGQAAEAIAPLLKSGYIGLGNTVFELEAKLAKYTGAKYAVAVDSCTSALFLCLKWNAQHTRGRTLAIPSMTVPLVADAAIEAGYNIIFNSETSWVGSMYQLGETGIFDSAHQLERNMMRKLDKKSNVCLSFYPTKSIGSADGGAILTNDLDLARWAKVISTYGRNQESKYANSWDYDIEMIGYKRHYTNLQAAICIEQLDRLDVTNKMRARVRDRYNKSLGYNNKSLYLYRIQVSDRDLFIEYMADQGIECGVHFKPLHKMKPFQNIPVMRPRTIETAYEHTVSLPLYDLLSEQEIDYIINRIALAPVQILPQ